MGFETEEEIIAAVDREPYARALVYPNGDVMLTPWNRGLRVLPTEQDTYRSIVEQGIKIVDLRRLISPSPETDLLSVRELFATSLDIEGNELTPEAQIAIADHARGLGFTRVWTDNFGLFELPGEVVPDAVASAECDHCHSTFRESSYSWWQYCFKVGMYPTCPVCRTAMAWHVQVPDSHEQAAADAAIADIVLDEWVDPHDLGLLAEETEENGEGHV